MEITEKNNGYFLGYKDNETAIFIDEKNYKEKFQQYINDPDNPKWEKIANAGREYTMNNLTNDQATNELVKIRQYLSPIFFPKKPEIIDPISPFFFDDNKKINCLFSSLNLLKMVLPEMLSYNSIYILFSNFLNELKFSNNWIIHYIFWEMNLLKKIGFDMNLPSNYVARSYNKMITVNIDNENINVPSFMVDKKFDNIDTKSIYYALTFIGKFLKKNILTPNNLNYPISRIKLENYFR